MLQYSCKMSIEHSTYRKSDLATILVETGFGGLRNDFQRLARVEERVISQPSVVYNIGSIRVETGPNTLMTSSSTDILNDWSGSIQKAVNIAPKQSSEVRQLELMRG